MTFPEALVWLSENEAKWGYERTSDGTYRLWLDAGDQRVELPGADSTEWACLLIDAVERVADTSPTERGVPFQSGSRPATEVAAILAKKSG